jgi:murein DD-endopeptidase MepM/ murein hydrolase activator NlpD
MVGWLKAEAPGVQLDPIDAKTPDELGRVLQQRISSKQRLGQVSASLAPANVAPPFQLLWPTDYPEVTQEFGTNPAVYRRWGLPGHEGVDIHAPLNASVYACAAGLVYRVHDGSGGHPYGIHVRIRHADGYTTIYAHLNQALVHAGQSVEAGERIGLADSTGNTTGGHLHLTLKKEGASAAGLTNYPDDILDPTPFLVFPAERRPPAPLPADWSFRHCLVGLHGRMDGPMQEADWAVVSTAQVEALKLLSSAPTDDVDRARAINPSMFILVRLSADFRNRVVSAADFAEWVAFDLERFYKRNVRYFEVHHEPNLTLEGYRTSWGSGREFAEWFLEVVGRLRPMFPEARFGWPGLSPGTSEGMRLDHRVFLESAGTLVGQADWIGCHCYWETEEGILAADGGLGYEVFRAGWPDKLVLITEFSNPASDTDAQSRASQYLRYYRYLYDQPGLGAAFSCAVSASSGFVHETWRGEDGQAMPIAAIIGSRVF